MIIELFLKCDLYCFGMQSEYYLLSEKRMLTSWIEFIFICSQFHFKTIWNHLFEHHAVAINSKYFEVMAFSQSLWLRVSSSFVWTCDTTQSISIKLTITMENCNIRFQCYRFKIDENQAMCFYTLFTSCIGTFRLCQSK